MKAFTLVRVIRNHDAHHTERRDGVSWYTCTTCKATGTGRVDHKDYLGRKPCTTKGK